jgi:hypothetical protein
VSARNRGFAIAFARNRIGKRAAFLLESLSLQCDSTGQDSTRSELHLHRGLHRLSICHHRDPPPRFTGLCLAATADDVNTCDWRPPPIPRIPCIWRRGQSTVVEPAESSKPARRWHLTRGRRHGENGRQRHAACEGAWTCRGQVTAVGAVHPYNVRRTTLTNTTTKTRRQEAGLCASSGRLTSTGHVRERRSHRMRRGGRRLAPVR